MLEMMRIAQAPSFLEKVKTVRHDIQDWNIMEVAIEEDWVGRLTPDEVSARLIEAFSDKEGVGLICNMREVLCLIKWGRERGVTELCARVENNLPDRSCSVEGADMTPEGIERVRVKLTGTIKDSKSVARLRAAHTKEIILIASADKEFKSAAFPIFQEYGRAVFVDDYYKMVQAYKEQAPEMLIWDVDTIRRGEEVPLKLILDMDDEASLICASNAMDASLILEAKKLGIENIVSKPIEGSVASRLIGNCPHFGWKT